MEKKKKIFSPPLVSLSAVSVQVGCVVQSQMSRVWVRKRLTKQKLKDFPCALIN